MKYLKSIIIFFTIIFLVADNKSFSQSSSRFSREKYTNGKGDTLQYRMLFPDANRLRKYPLVIFLHGSGERGNDNEAQLKWGVTNFATDQNMMQHPALVIVPQCPANDSWSPFTGPDRTFQQTPTKPMELLIELIHKMIQTMPVDSNRIYITGLSMGGYGTYYALTKYPDLFAAAVPVCGAGDTSKASTFAHVPIWIFHGAEDPAVNPIYSQQMFEALTKAGAHPGFTQYPESGHFSWLAAYSDPLMIEWLFRQHK
ncbi:MAG TPA: prolyl oligopeptidase family serine peptidase [Chitinophagaceae bacterium]|nr:prolyl oligopeptidase family serine peptidase [Chitinophagaceae bacterium]